MKNKLSTFQAHNRILGNTAACHNLLNVTQRQMFFWLLPNGAMLAARLAFCRGINHQRAQFLMLRTKEIVEV